MWNKAKLAEVQSNVESEDVSEQRIRKHGLLSLKFNKCLLSLLIPLKKKQYVFLE